MQTVSPPALDKKAFAELNSILLHREKFIKVHAAEYLIWTGHTEAPLLEFLKEEKLHNTEPKYRVVIWRVLAQAEKDATRKKMWLNKIYDAYKDMDAPDRTHASEALAKLRQPVAKLFPEVTAKTIASDDRNLKCYALWASSYGSVSRMNKNREVFLEQTLTDTNVIIRRISAFVLRKVKGLDLPQWSKLASAAITMDKANELYVTLLATALVTEPANADKKLVSKINSLLVNDISKYNVGQLTELAQALAESGEKKHFGLLEDLMENKNSAGIYDAASDEGADLRAAAAYAILEINSRKK